MNFQCIKWYVLITIIMMYVTLENTHTQEILNNFDMHIKIKNHKWKFLIFREFNLNLFVKKELLLINWLSDKELKGVQLWKMNALTWKVTGKFWHLNVALFLVFHWNNFSYIWRHISVPPCVFQELYSYSRRHNVSWTGRSTLLWLDENIFV